MSTVHDATAAHPASPLDDRYGRPKVAMPGHLVDGLEQLGPAERQSGERDVDVGCPHREGRQPGGVAYCAERRARRARRKSG